MPHRDPDPTDPMTLHGVVVETDDALAMREMTACFVEEYMRMGYGRDELLGMFKTPRYAGPHMAYRALGEEAIQTTIDEIAARFGDRPAETLPDPWR